MKLLRLLIPVLTCYATDVVAFEGEYFGRFLTQFEAGTASQSVRSAGTAMAGAWAPGDALASMGEIGVCRLTDATCR